MFGVYHQYRKISDVPNPGTGIPGHVSEHQYSAAQPSSRQGETDTSRSHQNLQNGLPLSSFALPLPGEAQCSNPGYPSSSTILPLPAEGSTGSPQQQQSGLRRSSVPLATLSKRTVLVEGTSSQMEWEASQAQDRASDYQFRCLPNRLGSSLCEESHRRCLFSSRTDNEHQFPGVSSSENFSEGCLRSINAPPAGQCNCSGLHQQHDRHSVLPADGSGKGAMDVGPQQGYHPDSPTHSGSVQYYSRHGVADSPRQVRPDALSSNLPDHHGSFRTTGCGPVCIQADSPGTLFLQLEAGSSGRGSGCILTGLGPIEGLCQPTVVLNRQSPESGTPPASPTRAGSTSMEGPNVVPSTTRNAMGLSQADNPSSRSNSKTNRCSNGDSPSTSRVACLRERFSSSSLSEEPTKLLLQSWRSKSAQSYNSQFQKWAVWCAERGRNPVSGPASDVANFPAELFEEGYQTSSLNSFRSAISSAHDQVDGVAIGKHPLICRVLYRAISFSISKASYLQACNAAGINQTFSFCRFSSFATELTKVQSRRGGIPSSSPSKAI